MVYVARCPVRCSFNLSKKEIAVLFSLFDTNGNGLLDYHEFIDVVLPGATPLPQSSPFRTALSTRVPQAQKSGRAMLQLCGVAIRHTVADCGATAWLAGGLGFTVFQDYDAAEHPLGKSSTKTPGPWSMELLAQRYCSHTDCSVSYPLLPILSAEPRGRASSRARACAHRYPPCGGVERRLARLHLEACARGDRQCVHREQTPPKAAYNMQH